MGIISSRGRVPTGPEIHHARACPFPTPRSTVCCACGVGCKMIHSCTRAGRPRHHAVHPWPRRINARPEAAMLTASRRWKRREEEPQAETPGLAVWLHRARARWQGVVRGGATLQRTCHKQFNLALDGVREALVSPGSRPRPGRLAFASASRAAVGGQPGPPGETLSSDPILISEVRGRGRGRAHPAPAWQALLLGPEARRGGTVQDWQRPPLLSEPPPRPQPSLVPPAGGDGRR